MAPVSQARVGTHGSDKGARGSSLQIIVHCLRFCIPPSLLLLFVILLYVRKEAYLDMNMQRKS